MLPISLVTNSVEQKSDLSRNLLIHGYGFREQLKINKTFLQDSFDLALKITGFKHASISFIDEENEYIHSYKEDGVRIIPIAESMGKLVLNGNDVLEIVDTTVDARTQNLICGVGGNSKVHYIAVPLINLTGVIVGALSIYACTTMDGLNEKQKSVLQIIAKQIMNTFEEQRKLVALIKEINKNFKPAACSDLSCLYGELGHLQIEVIEQSKNLLAQKNLLEISNDQLKSFAHVVAHDIKSPLKTITNFADLTKRSLKKGTVKKSEEYLEYVQKASTNLNDFVEDILHVAEANNDTQHTKVSLNNILDSVLLNLHTLIQQTNTKIELPKEDVHFTGHSSQLIQLFQNLVSNAIKYQDGTEPPSISIKAKVKSGKVKISVKDNGIGIAKENLKDIFKPFKRVNLDRQIDGLGIGLSTCQKIVSDHGSALKVKSKIGKGTKFKFSFAE